MVDLSDGDFHITLDPGSGATTCVVMPEGLSDAKACEGIDRARMASTMAAEGMRPSVAIVRLEAWQYMFVMQRTHITPREFDAGTAHEWARGARDAFRKHFGKAVRFAEGDDAEPTLSRVNGVQVATIEFTPQLAEGDPRRAVLGYSRQYAIASKAGVYGITFSASPEHAAEVRDAAEKILATLSAPAAPPAGGAKTLVVAASVGVVAVVAAIIVLVARATGRRREAPRRSPQPPRT